jgi:hypothetical protein
MLAAWCWFASYQLLMDLLILLSNQIVQLLYFSSQPQATVVERMWMFGMPFGCGPLQEDAGTLGEMTNWIAWAKCTTTLQDPNVTKACVGGGVSLTQKQRFSRG